MPKVNRDFPLSPTPSFNTSDSSGAPMTRKEFKDQKRQARREHVLESIKSGKRTQEVVGNVKSVLGVVKDVVETASDVKNVIGKSPSRMMDRK